MIITSAQARGVPIVSGRQMLEWLDGRNNSSFGGLTWNGAANTLTSPSQRERGMDYRHYCRRSLRLAAERP